MKRVLKLLGGLVLVVVLGGVGFLSLTPGLKSDPSVGLSPDTHTFADIDVREFTDAPLRAEVKVFLPITPQEAMPIVADFDSYGEWVSPPPANVVVDNSGAGGTFGPGTRVSYKEGETDKIVLYDPNVAMIAEPEWGLADFDDHRGVVIVIPHEGGSIMHMRRYFEPTSMKGWMMSKMMPMFMKKSAENLAERHGGEVL